MRTFEELEVWKSARDLRRDISLMIKNFPIVEQYNLSNQLRRASRSVTANIAEGYGRFHHQENIQFCRHSRGSLMELIDHLSVALEENYISEEVYADFRDRILHCNKILNGYILYLKNAKENG